MAIVKEHTGITPDFIVVDGAEGGTGAPLEFLDHMVREAQRAFVDEPNKIFGRGRLWPSCGPYGAGAGPGG